MQWDVICVIRPKINLIDALEGYEQSTHILNRSFAWQVPIGGVGGPLPNERMIGVKLIFLAKVNHMLSRMNVEESVEVFNKLFPEKELAPESFDNWWTLERIASYSTLHDQISTLGEKDFQNIAETGLRNVDNWIGNLRNMRDD